MVDIMNIMVIIFRPINEYMLLRELINYRNIVIKVDSYNYQNIYNYCYYIYICMCDILSRSVLE